MSPSRSDPSPAPAPPEDDRGYRPRWLLFAPFLGRAPALTRRQWSVLGLVTVATIFDQYDLALFSLALKQIQAELAIPEAQLGTLGAIIRMGALPSLLFAVLADRLGRRRILLVTIMAYTLLTGATAFAPDARSFVALQFAARSFAVAEVMLAFVVISEELDPAVRGWGVGALTALAACGHGLALLLFGLVDVLPMGWRALYLIGLGPLALVAWLRRSMPETERFARHREARARHTAPRGALAALRGGVGPLLDLVRVYPARFAAIAAVIFLLNFAENSAGLYGPKYLQEVHGWRPYHVTMLGLFGGVVAIVGGAWSGRLSDRVGRRPVGVAVLLAHPLLVVAYYHAFGAMLPPLWIGMIFCGMAGGVVVGTFGNELFPTSYRSTASGARMALGTLGGAAGLQAESMLYALVGSHWTAISLLVLLALAAPLVIQLFFPETSRRALEEISPERGG